MKKGCILVVMLCCFLSSALLAQSGNKKPVSSSSKDEVLKYVQSHQGKNVKIVKSDPRKEVLNYVASHQENKLKKSSRDSKNEVVSYVNSYNKSNIKKIDKNIQNEVLNYVLSHQGKNVKIVTKNSDNPKTVLVDNSKKSLSSSLSSEAKKINPIKGLKKMWNKVFKSPSNKTSKNPDTLMVPMTLEVDLSFDTLAYNSIAKWAEKNGKIFQVDNVAERYGDEIKTVCLEFGVDYRVIIALFAHESGGDPNAVSCVGAAGLGQMMPGTAAAYGVYDVFNPHQNLRGSIHYFSDMMKMFGNVKDALYAYGWGHGNAQKFLARGGESDKIKGIREVLYLAQQVQK